MSIMSSIFLLESNESKIHESKDFLILIFLYSTHLCHVKKLKKRFGIVVIYPDGFTFKFIKHYWDLVGKDFIDMIKNFETDGFIPRGCNSSFIALVLKIQDPLHPTDYRPISLIGCQYKVIDEVLANRLLQVVGSVVSEVQTTFIKGRQIVDGPLMVNEIIAWAKNKKIRLFLLRVDFEKAFDSLDWNFLDNIMMQMNFSQKWRMWIKGCHNSAYASVLINGSPTKEFKIYKGLRQGDPLSFFINFGG
nr:cysteine-rich receptor-like protein kinase [Tanacetum cinerariifolium]